MRYYIILTYFLYWPCFWMFDWAMRSYYATHPVGPVDYGTPEGWVMFWFVAPFAVPIYLFGTGMFLIAPVIEWLARVLV